MKTQILRILRNSDSYISGQSLCELLGVSRTAVWKAIKQLKEEGYEIEAVSNRGYKIVRCPDIVTVTELKSALSENSFIQDIYYYEETDSTNNQARLLAEKGAVNGTLVVAESQISGKGRRGRSWSSQKGNGIWMSFILKPRFEPSKASMLTLICAMAVHDGLQKQGINVQIKWPNDIIADGRKVCGILTEMSTQMECINYVVAGIGINVHQTEFPEEIRQVAASLATLTGRQFHRAEIMVDVLTAFEYYYHIFIEKGDLSGIMEAYNERLVNMNRQVKIVGWGNTEEGVSRGIDAHGALLVEIDGEVRPIVSGEVSVRGILGYV